jgi:Tfp pilus assembly protein PilP
VYAEGRSTSAAKTISSPHPEISIATAGNTLFVSTPQMKEANAILKADGPGAMKWDGSANAYAVKVEAGDVTTQNAGNIAEITKRLSAVAEFYETKCLIAPSVGRPGIAAPSEAQQAIFKTATPATYASDPSVQKAVDGFNKQVETALSDPDRRALLNHKPGETIASERLAALPKERIEAVTTLVQHVQTVQSQGVSKQLDQARAQSQTQAPALAQ